MTDDAFDQLVLRYFDHELSDSEFASLQATLAESLEARRRYHQLAELNGLLASVVAQSQPFPAERPLRPPAPLHHAPVDQTEPPPRQRPKRLMPRMLAAVAIVAVAAVMMNLVWTRMRQPLVTFHAAPGTMLEATDAGAAKGEANANVGNLGIGSRLQLRQGAVALEFATGVKALVSAPADLTVVSQSQLRMEEGRGHFTVPSKAVGFTVVADGLEVIDLGTEFGVATRPVGGGAEVHVFKGQVRAVSSTGRGEVLKAGMARLAEGGSTSLREISLTPSLFPSSLTDPLVSQVALTVVPLTGHSNSTAYTESGFNTTNNHVGVTLNDPFPYDPNTYSPIVGAQPARGNIDASGFNGVGFHGNDGPGPHFLRYTFSRLTTMQDGALFVVDLWGRNHEPAYPRLKSFTINLYNDSFSGAPVATLTSGIPASAATQYGRTTFVLPQGVTFDRFEITSDTAFFSVAETRAAFHTAP